jgi:electron transfer flavoprotein beta subunit
MNTVVCVKITPDTAQLKADPETGRPRFDLAPLRVSSFDENALEAAVRLREKYGGRVVALSMVAAPAPPELMLKVLAMGADAVYLVEDPSADQADALATALILSAAIRKLQDWNLVLCGDGSLDHYNRQVGPRLAEELGIAVLTQVTQISSASGRLIVHRSTEDSTEVFECETPLVLTVGQEINQPRFPTVLQILGASKKPVVNWTACDLGFSQPRTAERLSATETLELLAPAVSRQRLLISAEDTEQLAAGLAKKLSENGLVKIS